MNVELETTGPEQPDFAIMLQVYLAELSTWTGQVPDVQGRYAYPFLDHYQDAPDRQIYLARSQEKTESGIIGLAMVRQEIDPADGSVVREIAEFYVEPACRRKGVARTMLSRLLAKSPGRWQLGVLPGNTSALAFWRTALQAYAVNIVEVPPVGPHERHIQFRFEANQGTSD